MVGTNHHVRTGDFTMNRTNARSKKIAALNDALRQRGIGGRIMLTQGIQALGQAAVNDILAKIKSFDTFSEDNDPYGERDFGSIKHGNQKVLFKIDYYDTDLQYASPDPTDPTKTCRVMTIMTADEY